jgi:hypothetical protein
VEWPEKAPGIFPPDTVHLSIEILPGAEADQEPGTRYLRTFTTAS